MLEGEHLPTVHAIVVVGSFPLMGHLGINHTIPDNVEHLIRGDGLALCKGQDLQGGTKESLELCLGQSTVSVNVPPQHLLIIGKLNVPFIIVHTNDTKPMNKNVQNALDNGVH